VEDEVYFTYLQHLFQSASRYVIIYSSNQDINNSARHERHRKFTKDIERLFSSWSLATTIENKIKPKDWADEEGSIADFYIYKMSS
jgi:hypothetical protein